MKAVELIEELGEIDSGGIGTIEELPLDQLLVDHGNYQRPEGRRSKWIGEKFRADLCGMLTVNRRPDGTLSVIDGQQRRGGLLLRGVTHWPCRVLSLPGPKEEAEAYSLINGGKDDEGHQMARPLSAKQLFIADLRRGEAVTCAAVAVAKKHGLKLVPSGNSKWPHPNAVKLTVDICRPGKGETLKDGEARLDRIFNVIVKCWPGDDNAMKACFTGGLYVLFSRHPQISDKRLIEACRRVPAMAVYQAAQLQNRVSGSSSVLAARFLAEQYNRCLKKHNRIVID